MNARCLLRSIHLLILIVALVVLGPPLSANAQEKVIYNFQSVPDGSSPHADLVMDAKGNLYGTTAGGGASTCAEQSGGSSPCGVVFRLTPPSVKGGSWSETVLYSFLGPSGDGEFPESPLLLDGNGNLYGTTPNGGNGLGGGNIMCGSFSLIQGCGIVFELSPPTQEGAAWTKKTLYNFQGLGDGYVPVGRLAMDAKGNLYGATLFDGTAGFGVAFELSPPTQGSGSWTENVLYNFQGNGDGSYPEGGLLLDRRGNLFGVTNSGGSANLGTVFRLSPTNGHAWTENVLHSFLGGSDGASPSSGLTVGPIGGLYGTTSHGGTSSNCFQAGCGTVYNLAWNAGVWTEKVLYSFQGNSDGQYPYAGVAFDKQGNLYGTTYQGGSVNVYLGTIFRLTPSGSSWKEQIVHSFHGSPDGASPFAGLVFGTNGRLFGTTSGGGGGSGVGTVFELSTPSAPTPGHP